MCMFCVKKSYVFSRAFTYFKPYTKKLIITGLLLSLANVLNAVMPLFNSVLIDHYLVPTEGVTPYFSSRAAGVIAIASCMVLLYVLSRVIVIVSNRISNKIGSGFSKDLREILYGKIQELSLTSMSRRPAGNLIHRVTTDTERVKEFFNQQGKYLIEQAILFTVILIVLFCTNPLLTILVLLPIPVAIIMMRKFNHSTHLRYQKQWRVNSKAS